MSSFLKYELSKVLIFINVITYLFSAFSSQSIIDIDIDVLKNLGAIYGPVVVSHEEWWRLITAMFLHVSMTHLLMNMFSLYLIGKVVEQYFDTKSYLSIYFVSGILGGLVSMLIHPAYVLAGASGGIFGIFGAMAGFFMAHREELEGQTKTFMKDFGMIIGINLLIGLFIPEVDVSAHVGGLIVGFVGGYMISKNNQWFVTYNAMMILLMFGIAYFLTGQYAEPTLFA